MFSSYSLTSQVTSASLQKHGGHIHHDFTTADFAIPKDQPAQMIQARIDDNKPTVTASFVKQSVERGQLLDHCDYTYEVSDKDLIKLGKKRARDTSNKEKEPQVKADKKVKLEKETTVTKKPSKSADTPRRTSGQPNIFTPRAASSSRAPRSPTPPGLESRELMSEGKYYYTACEKEYIMKYLRILLQRDHLITRERIVEKLHKKVGLFFILHLEYNWIFVLRCLTTACCLGRSTLTPSGALK